MQVLNILIPAICVILMQIQSSTMVDLDFSQNSFNVTMERVERLYINQDIFDYFDIKSGRTSRRDITVQGCTKTKVDIDKIVVRYKPT